jgi:DNA invertase Pin-like site-specific DNA recombinase
VIETWAKQNKISLAPEIIEQGVSGSKPWRERALGEALQAVEAGDVQGIVVAFQDRLSREHGLATAEVWQALEKAQARLVCAGEGLDTATGDHELLFSIKAAIAREQWKRHKTNWASARLNAIERGVYLARAPFGYVKNEVGRLEPDPVTAPIVGELYERRARGERYRLLADWLEDEGIRKAHSDKPWLERDVWELLANNVYIGISEVDGLARNESAHAPLVDSETWWRVRHQATKGHAPSGRGKHVLTGLVRCEGCGTSMIRSKTSPRGKVYYYWRCRYDRCENSAGVSALAFEPYVLRLVAEVATVQIEKPRQKTEVLDAARAAVEDAEARLESFESTWVAQGLDPAGAIAMRKPLVEALDQARKTLSSIPPEEGDLLEQIRQAYALPQFREWLDATEAEARGAGEQAVAEVERVWDEGLGGESLLAILSVEPTTSSPEIDKKLNEFRRKLLRQVLSSVTVRGKSGELDERVEIVLRPEVAPAAN